MLHLVRKITENVQNTFLFFLACLIGLSVWLTDNPGSVTIYWLGYEIQTYFGVLLVSVLGLLISILLLARMVRVICKSPREFFNARKRRRETEGYKALTFGMAAVAAGDKDEATKFSKQADKLLGNPRITRLLSRRRRRLMEMEKQLQDISIPKQRQRNTVCWSCGVDKAGPAFW